MHVPRPARRRSRGVWAVVSLSAAAALLMSPPSAAAEDSARTGGGSPKVDAALARALEDGGEAAFFVVLDGGEADLAGARGRKAHGAKAEAAYDALREHARQNQRSLVSFLDKEKVGHQDFWIADVVRVEGDAELAAKLAARSDVARLVKERRYALDEVEQQGGTVAAAATPQWGVADIKADQVWEQYENRGEGIVIANIDSGVQFDHPDLVANYRGNKGDGRFEHDYNWFDPTGQCPTAGVPCDNNGHGTHTMGTMAGANGYGVAPGATWIAAKGCEARECSDASLLAAGQWILAPTDRNGQNPRPDLAPHIVNNSWAGGNTTFYQDIVEAWNAAGIFEVFAAGNAGDGTTCSTAEAPGAQAPSYGVGAYDSNGAIASFSGFGPSKVDGSMKPNISAPGVDVRSTWPGSTYRASSGTSMAAPHVSGAAALLWSAAPSLIGDIDATRALLNQGAHDVDDTHCGGTAAANNVWGEGRLDILASVDKAPHTAATVSGRVTDKATGAALPGITVKAVNGASGTRTVTTGADGTYRVPLAPGTYDFTLGGYGYATRTVEGVELTTGQPLVQDLALDPVARHAVTGTVLDVTGKPLAGAAVEVTGTPVAKVRTAGDGTFTLPEVAEGGYTLTVTPAAPVLCNGVARTELTVDGAEARTVRLPARADRFGNSCAPAAYAWIKGTGTVALSGDEDAKTVQLPFPVSLYGVEYTSASVTTNGLVNFLEPRLGDYANTALPAAEKPNGIVAPYWDDLTLDRKSSVQTATTGQPGARKFAVVWNNAVVVASGARVSFEAVFDEASGGFTFQYQSVPGAGSGATVGIEDQAGSDALLYSFDQAVLGNGSAVRIAQGAK
ncbi:S8 family serine peptidase [Streptomyces indicus]|uniref:Serine protease, subtilisin family n=1 Tax=Streptomyces indicus TaxID=417292 RepID=A0A1G9CJS1_9ACTN|nr:S8 family serine peptidase [Streptomyces indicus]SDK51665.1 Serine protease, subtilisin family [Streptomyces indicus]